MVNAPQDLQSSRTSSPSAATVSLPNPAPEAPPSLQEQAAAGHFRAIALWVNEPLVDQGIYVQVQADKPGCLMLLVEFEQPPVKERLIRFLCHRIWLLNSPLIEGIHIAARPIGHRRPLWEQRIRIVTPALKARKQTVQPAAPKVPVAKALPPRIREVAAPPPVSLVNRHLKSLRAFMLTGSAVAAFVMGCLMEVILSGVTPSLPTFSADQAPGAKTRSVATSPVHPIGTADFTEPQATPVNYASSPDLERPPIVDAAVEPVAVIPYDRAAQPDSADITLLFGGDVSLDDVPYGDLPDEAALLEGVQEYLAAADVSMVNLGTPLATAATSLEEEFQSRTRRDAIDLLKAGGVDIVSLSDADNMNFGEQGLTETLDTLDSKGIYRVGAGRNETEARRPEILDVKGKRIAYLSYAQGGDEAAFEDRPGVNAQGLMEISQDIRALRNQVDWIVVNYRWQTDLPERPADWQTNLARLAIDQGADLVVGYHPHKLQGAEIYKGRPIAYSLGDFVFQEEPDQDQDTAMLKVSLRGDQMKVELLPVQVRDAHPQVVDGEAGKAILEQVQTASEQFEKPLKSPLVLDLNAQPAAPEKVDPSSPFAAPDGDLLIPINDPGTAPEASPEAAEKALPEGGTGSLTAPLPTPSPEHLEGPLFNPPAEGTESLDQWGPKVQPQEKPFAPIPQSPEGRGLEQIDAKILPNLLQIQMRQAAANGLDDATAETEPAETEQAETEQAETEQAETEQAETEPTNLTEQAETEQVETEQDKTEPSSLIETAESGTTPIDANADTPASPAEAANTVDVGTGEAPTPLIMPPPANTPEPAAADNLAPEATAETMPATANELTPVPSGTPTPSVATEALSEADPEVSQHEADPPAEAEEEEPEALPTLSGPALTPVPIKMLDKEPNPIKPTPEPLVGPLGAAPEIAPASNAELDIQFPREQKIADLIESISGQPDTQEAAEPNSAPAEATDLPSQDASSPETSAP